MTSEKSREQHARRGLRRLGFELWKSRIARLDDPNARYLVFTMNTGTDLKPRSAYMFASIEDIEAWLKKAEEVQAITS